MKYFAGIDGGGTKTRYIVVDENGHLRGEYDGPGCSYKHLGMEGAGEEIFKGVQKALERFGKTVEELSCVGIGMSCYGEEEEADREMESFLKKKFSAVPIRVFNDAEAGWAGATGLKPGIHLVAGTGSIAFGKNEKGESFRAGGWSEFFSDGGSGYWCGKKAMELFAKEADGIFPKGALYELIRKRFSLKKDFDFITKMEKEYLPYRDKTASLQKTLLLAARLEDEAAKAAYREAARELSLLVAAVENALGFSDKPVKVTAFGGMFHGKEYLLPELEKRWKITPPDFPPEKGAILLALESFFPESVEELSEKWRKNRKEEPEFF